ncbi:MAG TPA: hypothetical protein VF070_25115 [Streptosporangiaceae bacterium]
MQPAQAVQYARTRAVATATCLPALRAVSLSPASVPGGAPSTVTATLTCTATKTLTITLTGFPGTRVPAALHVAVGKISASGTITTATRKAAVRGWITGTLGNSRQRALLTIGVTPKTCESPALSAVSLPSLAYVGDHVVLAVKLSCPSTSAVRLPLTSTDTPASAPLIPMPTTVTIGAYYSVANIVLAPKAYQPGQYKSMVSVRFGKTLSRTITVDPGLSVFANTGDSCSPNTVNPYIYFTGHIPSGGLTVKLKSDNAAITVPATVAFTQPGLLGGQISGVTVKTVTMDTRVTLSATLGSRTLTLSIVLLRPWQSGDKITLTPSPGSGPFYGPSGYEYLVYLSHPAPADGNGLTGTATTDHPGDVQNLNSQVNVTPGCDNATISFGVPYEAHPVHATVTVSLGGSTATASLTIEPSLASVTIPATIVGGQASTGTVTLAGAPDAPDTVYLQSTWGILTVPGSVTIPAGQTSVAFPITTATVTSDSQVSVSAWHAVSTQMADSVASNTTDVTP